MPGWAWIVIGIAAVVVLVAALWGARQAAKRKELRERFGPEYDRTVSQASTRGEAEAELAGRAERREQLDIRPLPASSRERYIQTWRVAEMSFVDDPAAAVRDADQLIMRVMKECGYPVDDFEQQASDISVDHPEVVRNYRAAHDVAVAVERGRSTTEDQRQAMRHYRVVFDELVENEGARTGVA